MILRVSDLTYRYPGGTVPVLSKTKQRGARLDPAKVGAFHRAFAIMWLLIWYALAIYLVVVTLGIQQFQERLNTVAVTGSKTFAALRVLEIQKQSAAAAVQAAEMALAARESEITGIRAEIEKTQIKQLGRP